jgi:hypothetical protein
MTISNLEKYKKDLEKLILLGDKMHLDLVYQALERQRKLTKDEQEAKTKLAGSFEDRYQRWFTEAQSVLKQLLPDRLSEFEDLYKLDSKRKSIDVTSYTIQDWLMGVRSNTDYRGKRNFDDFAVVIMRFRTQTEILKSVEARFESKLFEIKQLVQADIFDSELAESKELLKNGFVRGAGVIAGVVLEKHLAQTCSNHNVSTRKKHPSVSDFNDALKKMSVTDVPTWRQIQRLGDIRNLCGHNKEREPTRDEVGDLIDGVEKITKRLY